MGISIAKTLEHVAVIDFCYWRLEELNEKLNKPKHPIEEMIDTACGYDENKEIREDVISLLEQIIDSKRAIGYDCTGDELWLEKFKKIGGLI